jgi:hypothetical protein
VHFDEVKDASDFSVRDLIFGSNINLLFQRICSCFRKITRLETVEFNLFLRRVHDLWMEDFPKN